MDQLIFKKPPAAGVGEISCGKKLTGMGGGLS